MAYEVLARKWRPQTFAEVVGQEHVSTTLANAITQGRVGHAYLFSGIRGVGKTTTARILAKAVNCAEGPTPSPCGKCTPCVEIARGMSLDTIEIDGASNRGVDEIRSLREKIGYAPVGGKRKVYIIDEVHMLTTEAFNALLKTLEEPPAHALFILATTNKVKVPATIRSRCQHFHFRRIATAAIEEHLGMMVKEEGIAIEPAALALIARRGDGSLRDAESLLEQVAALGGGARGGEAAGKAVKGTKGASTPSAPAISAAEVREFLGLLEEDQVFEAGRALVDGQGEPLLAGLERVVRSGGDPAEFAEALTGHFRNLMVVSVAPDSEALAELSREDLRRYREEAERLRGVDLLIYLEVLGGTLAGLRKSTQPRLELEVALLGLAGRSRPAAGGGAAGGAGHGHGESPRREPAAATPAKDDHGKARPAARKPARATGEEEAAGGMTAPGADRSATSASRAMEAATPTPAPASSPPPAAEAAGVALPADPLVIGAVRDVWDAFVEEVNRKRRALGAFVAAGVPSRVEEGRLVIGFTEEQKYSMSQVERRENRLYLAGLLGNLLGREVTLVCDRMEAPPEAAPGAGTPAPSAAAPAAETLAEDAGLRRLMDAFDARIIDVRAPKPEADGRGGDA